MKFHRHLYFESLNSTQTKLKELFKVYCSTEKAVLSIRSGSQSSGIGNSGSWYSPPGNLYLSFGTLFPAKNARFLPFIPFYIGNKVLEHLNSEFNLACKQKWVNDIILERKKLGGIICQSETGNGTYLNLYVGIGINCNTEQFTNLNATSLKLRTKKDVDILNLCDSLMARFLYDLNSFVVDPEPLLPYIRKKTDDNLAFKSEMVQICSQREKKLLAEGKLEGLSDNFGLIIQDPSTNKKSEITQGSLYIKEYNL